MITEDQLGKIIDRMSYKPKQGDIVESLNKSMQEANINTPLRVAMYMAQILFETSGFKWFVELGNPAYFLKYEGRTDLGNTQRGDGYKFRGRGFIQITGRYNYTKVGEALGLDLVTSPDTAADLLPGARIAGWYWMTRKLNIPSDVRDIKKVTHLINGGLNGFSERLRWYGICKNALGA